MAFFFKYEAFLMSICSLPVTSCACLDLFSEVAHRSLSQTVRRKTVGDTVPVVGLVQHFSGKEDQCW